KKATQSKDRKVRPAPCPIWAAPLAAKRFGRVGESLRRKRRSPCFVVSPFAASAPDDRGGGDAGWGGRLRVVLADQRLDALLGALDAVGQDVALVDPRGELLAQVVPLGGGRRGLPAQLVALALGSAHLLAQLVALADQGGAVGHLPLQLVALLLQDR